MTGVLTKVGMGVALAATAITSAAPAEAQRWRGYRGHRGGDTAAAAILGGVVGLGVGAAIASSNRDRYYDRGYYNDRGYAPRYRYRPRGYYRDYYAQPRPRVVYRGYYGDPYYGGGGGYYGPRGYGW